MVDIVRFLRWFFNKVLRGGNDIAVLDGVLELFGEGEVDATEDSQHQNNLK